MNRKQQSVVLASLLALALAGCSSTKGSSDEMGGGATASGSGSASGSTGAGTAATASGADSMAMPAQAPGAAGQASMPAAPPNAVVMLIEVMPRTGATGAVGGSGTAGTTGSSSMGDEKMYRITLRMDDGTTRVVTQDKSPNFRNGDRVNMMDGMISH
jgi:hypothetical protein